MKLMHVLEKVAEKNIGKIGKNLVFDMTFTQIRDGMFPEFLLCILIIIIIVVVSVATPTFLCTHYLLYVGDFRGQCKLH